MYICKDCGAKFAQKVEYCDCGNNTFDFVEDKPTLAKTIKKEKKQPLTYEQKGEILSRLFLIFCVILSIIIWAIPVKVDNAKQNETTEIKVQNIKNIPPIENFWDDTPVYSKNETEEAKTITENIISEPTIPDYAKPKPIEQKKTIQKQNPKTEQKQVKQTQQKNQTTVNKTSEAKQKVQSKIQKTEQKQAAKPKNNNDPSPKLYEPSIPKTTQNKPKTEFPKSTYNPNSPEMLQYKGSLRAAMFSKFAVGSIQGSGSCSVKFSIDSTGKLINRAFVKQSDNKSLNDAVYYMLMSVPRFATPPAGYNGETIRMYFSINNGSYEISIY